MMIECTICNDVVDQLAFCCSTSRCEYGLCSDCLKDAFKDVSGDNVRNCPMCKKDTALLMIESVCGKGAIREVERGLRSRVEHEVLNEYSRRFDSKKTMDQYKERASEIFSKITEVPYSPFVQYREYSTTLCTLSRLCTKCDPT
jgi:hypothetical protein